MCLRPYNQSTVLDATISAGLELAVSGLVAAGSHSEGRALLRLWSTQRREAQ